MEDQVGIIDIQGYTEDVQLTVNGSGNTSTLTKPRSYTEKLLQILHYP